MSTKAITKVCLWCPMFSLRWPILSGQTEDNLLCSWGVYENHKVFSGEKLIMDGCNLSDVAQANRERQGRLTLKHWLQLTWWRIKTWWHNTDSEVAPITLVSYRQTEEFARVKSVLIVLTIDASAKNGIILRAL